MNVLVKTQKIQVLLRGALGRGKVHQALVMGHNVCFGAGGGHLTLDLLLICCGAFMKLEWSRNASLRILKGSERNSDELSSRTFVYLS